MFLDFTDDHLQWDNTTSVVYESARANPSVVDLTPFFDGKTPAPIATPPRNQRCFISIAKRRNLTQRELAASGGVYTGDDQVWILPDVLFPKGFRSKAADVVIEAVSSTQQPSPEQTNQRWTVLDVAWNKNRQTRRLTCRNPVIAFDLRELITIERPALSYDLAGVPVKQFPSDTINRAGIVLYANLPARAQLVGKETAEMYGIQGLAGKYQVFVGQEVDVTKEDRVLLANGLYLDIVGYQQAMRIDQLPFLVCERRI